MNKQADKKLQELMTASLNTVNATASLNYQAQELHRSVERVVSIHEIEEEIESVTVLAQSIRTVEQNLQAIRKRFSI